MCTQPSLIWPSLIRSPPSTGHLSGDVAMVNMVTTCTKRHMPSHVHVGAFIAYHVIVVQDPTNEWPSRPVRIVFLCTCPLSWSKVRKCMQQMKYQPRTRSYDGQYRADTCPHGLAVRSGIRRHCPCTHSYSVSISYVHAHGCTLYNYT